MAGKNYYMLVSSLPRLLYFRTAEWLPISRRQLDQRLSMLTEEHRLQLHVAENLVKWQQPTGLTSREFVGQYNRLLPKLTDLSLREFVEFSMTQRTVMAALRRRRLGLGPPGADEIWGAGPSVRRILSAWDSPDFGLGQIMPWLDEASKLIEEDNALEIERLLNDITWTRLGRIAERSPFGFEPVIAFVFRWDILQRRLSYDVEAGRKRFQDLILEVTNEQKQLFN